MSMMQHCQQFEQNITAAESEPGNIDGITIPTRSLDIDACTFDVLNSIINIIEGNESENLANTTHCSTENEINDLDETSTLIILKQKSVHFSSPLEVCKEYSITQSTSSSCSTQDVTEYDVLSDAHKTPEQEKFGQTSMYENHLNISLNNTAILENSGTSFERVVEITDNSKAEFSQINENKSDLCGENSSSYECEVTNDSRLAKYQCNNCENKVEVETTNETTDFKDVQSGVYETLEFLIEGVTNSCHDPKKFLDGNNFSSAVVNVHSKNLIYSESIENSANFSIGSFKDNLNSGNVLASMDREDLTGSEVVCQNVNDKQNIEVVNSFKESKSTIVSNSACVEKDENHCKDVLIYKQNFVDEYQDLSLGEEINAKEFIHILENKSLTQNIVEYFATEQIVPEDNLLKSEDLLVCFSTCENKESLIDISNITNTSQKSTEHNKPKISDLSDKVDVGNSIKVSQCIYYPNDCDRDVSENAEQHFTENNFYGIETQKENKSDIKNGNISLDEGKQSGLDLSCSNQLISAKTCNYQDRNSYCTVENISITGHDTTEIEFNASPKQGDLENESTCISFLKSKAAEKKFPDQTLPVVQHDNEQSNIQDLTENDSSNHCVELQLQCLSNNVMMSVSPRNEPTDEVYIVLQEMISDNSTNLNEKDSSSLSQDANDDVKMEQNVEDQNKKTTALSQESDHEIEFISASQLYNSQTSQLSQGSVCIYEQEDCLCHISRKRKFEETDDSKLDDPKCKIPCLTSNGNSEEVGSVNCYICSRNIEVSGETETKSEEVNSSNNSSRITQTNLEGSVHDRTELSENDIHDNSEKLYGCDVEVCTKDGSSLCLSIDQFQQAQKVLSQERDVSDKEMCAEEYCSNTSTIEPRVSLFQWESKSPFAEANDSFINSQIKSEFYGIQGPAKVNPLPRCTKSRRVGLSMNQRVKPLHPVYKRPEY